MCMNKDCAIKILSILQLISAIFQIRVFSREGHYGHSPRSSSHRIRTKHFVFFDLVAVDFLVDAAFHITVTYIYRNYSHVTYGGKISPR